MYDAIPDLAATVAAIAEAVRPDRLDGRTPCDRFGVAELLAHLGGTLAAAERAARKQPPPDGTGTPATPAEVAAAARAVGAAWADPAAYEGTTTLGGPGELPAAVAAAITTQELGLHGWDLAQATGQAFHLADDTAEAVLTAVGLIAETARANGGYGPPVDAPAGSGPLARALAASGRDPGWAGAAHGQDSLGQGSAEQDEAVA